VTVWGLVATLGAVTVDVQAESVLLLGVSTQGLPKVSVTSDEPKPTVPNGLNDGL